MILFSAIMSDANYTIPKKVSCLHKLAVHTHTQKHQQQHTDTHTHTHQQQNLYSLHINAHKPSTVYIAKPNNSKTQ